jgi:hypothetical protein
LEEEMTIQTEWHKNHDGRRFDGEVTTMPGCVLNDWCSFNRRRGNRCIVLKGMEIVDIPKCPMLKIMGLQEKENV